MSTEPNEGQSSLSTEELIAAVFAATLPQVIEQVMGENLLWPEQTKLFPEVKEEAF